MGADLEEPSDGGIELEERVDAEDESAHAGHVTHRAQLIHLIGELGVQGNALNHFITRVRILSILLTRKIKKKQKQIIAESILIHT